MNLNLPKSAVPDRVSKVAHVQPNTRSTLATLDGPGCIRHIFLVLSHPHRTPASSRKAILRIYFDDEPVPYVEAPAGDFFGVMHGEGYYDIDSKYLSVKAWNGYNCYFPMPFVHSLTCRGSMGCFRETHCPPVPAIYPCPTGGVVGCGSGRQ